MHYFLDPDFIPSNGQLCEEESHHATRALRLSKGDQLLLGTGKGQIYTCTIAEVGKKTLHLEVLSEQIVGAPAPSIHLAIAPLKNTSRFEWFVEKATEIGADTIIPLLTHRTERPRLNTDRIQRLILAATKQSNRAWIPQLAPLTNFDEVIKNSKGLKLIAHCEDSYSRKPLRHCLPSGVPDSILIIIGPEGDFTPEEIETAYHRGFAGCDLGSNRLRTETAGIFCVSLLSGFYR